MPLLPDGNPLKVLIGPGTIVTAGSLRRPIVVERMSPLNARRARPPIFDPICPGNRAAQTGRGLARHFASIKTLKVS